MSLVYDKGTILASKREGYETATPENDVKERVNKQHKLICAAVKAGRVEDLKEMTASGPQRLQRRLKPRSWLRRLLTRQPRSLFRRYRSSLHLRRWPHR